MLNALRWWIAKMICPEMNGEAERYRFLSTQILNDLRWLGEFPDVRDTLQRILHMTFDHFRPLMSEAITQNGWARIEHFREDLRKRRAQPKQWKEGGEAC